MTTAVGACTDLELYGEHVAIEFGWWLRGMVAYEGIDPLLVQMADGVARTHELTSAAAASAADGT